MMKLDKALQSSYTTFNCGNLTGRRKRYSVQNYRKSTNRFTKFTVGFLLILSLLFQTIDAKGHKQSRKYKLGRTQEYHRKLKSKTNSPTISRRPSYFPTSKPSVSPTISHSPSATPTAIPSFRPTTSPSSSPSGAPSATPSAWPSKLPSVAPSRTPSYHPSPSPSTPPTISPSGSPTETHSASPSSTPSTTPSNKPSGDPSGSPTSSPSTTPTSTPSATHSSVPSNAPSSTPSASPSSLPSIAPSSMPTMTHSSMPSTVPSSTPSASPNSSPSIAPSSTPTVTHSFLPSSEPSASPNSSPSIAPSSTPTATHSFLPSSEPSASPNSSPSITPSSTPTVTHSFLPSSEPSAFPSSSPSVAPSPDPTSAPSSMPSVAHSSTPSETPTIRRVTNMPSKMPTSSPSTSPSGTPSTYPSITPTIKPSSIPSSAPTSTPSSSPHITPSSSPTITPSFKPTGSPSSKPTNIPSMKPSMKPSDLPSAIPTTLPSSSPSNSPSAPPSTSPSSNPTFRPSITPSNQPSVTPIAVSTTVNVELVDVPSGQMDDQTVVFFTQTAGRWLQNNFNDHVPPIKNLETRVLEQRTVERQAPVRRLQEGINSLFLQISADGTFQPIEGFTTPESIRFEGKTNFFFENFFETETLIEDLKSQSNVTYFNNAKEMFYIDESIDQYISTIQTNNNPIFEERNGPNTSMIVAVSVSAGAFVLFAVALYGFIGKRRRRMDAFDSSGERENELVEVQEEKIFSGEDFMIPVGLSGLPSNDDRDGAVNDDGTDGGTEAGRSHRTFSTLDKLYNQENMSYQSYGYSLEEGIESKATLSPSSGLTPTDTPSVVNLDQVNCNLEDDMTIEGSNATPTDSYSALTGMGTYNLSDKNSNLDAESANNKGETSESDDQGFSFSMGDNSALQSEASSSIVEHYEKEFLAPAGKLGVIIDTTKNGPVVHLVKEGSPLENKIFAGDMILSIDDVDVSGMTASGVTKVMGKKIDNERVIKVSSKEP